MAMSSHYPAAQINMAPKDTSMGIPDQGMHRSFEYHNLSSKITPDLKKTDQASLQRQEYFSKLLERAEAGVRQFSSKVEYWYIKC